MSLAGRFNVLAAGLLVCAAVAAQPNVQWFEPTLVDDSPVVPVVRSQIEGEFNGAQLTLNVIAGELLLADGEGRPAATMFSTAYVRADGGPPSRRPVLFLFNGGPGASSSPLHLGIGPLRRPREDPDAPLAVNPVSPVDAVDMVFVDPVGTGYTRLLRDDAGEPFWGIDSDADSVLLLIRTWLAENGREESPVFIMGESYGGTRAAAMAGRANDSEISGVLLLSPALDFSAGAQVVGNNLPYIFLVPSMAATAAYHGVTDPAGRTYLQIFDDAARWAQSEYAAALYPGNTIGPERAMAVAQTLSKWIGLSPEYVLESNLRVELANFSDQLLAAEGMRVGRLDARQKGELAKFKDRRPPGDDPSMGGNRADGRSTGEVLDEYYRERLGLDLDRRYRTLNLDLNQKWDYGQKSGRLKTYYSVVPRLQEALRRDPGLRVFIAGGVFDLVTPIMAARYAASQIDADPARFEFRGYEGGHTTFEHEQSRVALCQDIREFTGRTLRQNGAASSGRSGTP